MLLFTLAVLALVVGSSTATCPQGQLPCMNNTLECFDREELCDGMPHCADESDENLCNPCGTMEFKCNTSLAPLPTNCIPFMHICDGSMNCPGGEDEDMELCQDCVDGMIACSDGTCVNVTSFCNGTATCPDDMNERPEICGCQVNETLYMCDDTLTCLGNDEVCSDEAATEAPSEVTTEETTQASTEAPRQTEASTGLSSGALAGIVIAVIIVVLVVVAVIVIVVIVIVIKMKSTTVRKIGPETPRKVKPAAKTDVVTTKHK